MNEPSTGLVMKYFILKPRSKRLGDPFARASREAMRAFAKSIADTDSKLATELWDWVRRETKREEDMYK